MAGGTWLSQNKVRPGAYINFKAVPKSSMTTGDRGIVAMGLNLDWGKEGELIEVLSSDLLDGSSRKAVGFTAFDEESKLLAGALSYAYKALVYRKNVGGTKASATLGQLVVTARYNGTFGNKIIIAIEVENLVYTVTTYVDGETVDVQKVSEVTELTDNDYVIFRYDNTIESDTVIAITAGTALAGGSNADVSDTDAYPRMLKLLNMAHWQTMACFSSEAAIKSNVLTFIKQMRDDEGRYVQAVLADYDGADYEGVINLINGVTVDGVDFTKEEAAAIVAGMTAGVNFNESNTARKVTGATKVIGELTNTEIIKALGQGKFLFSTNSKGEVKVEQDINSLHTYTKDRNYNFSKNRVIRTLDEIGTTTKETWEDTYMGKVDNNGTGRSLFKADLVSYGNELQRLSGIQEFNGSDDIEISQGNDLDSVLVTWAVKPVDSMEKLYMTVNVRS